LWRPIPQGNEPKKFCGERFLKEMSRKSLWRPIPQGNEPKKFLASDFLEAIVRRTDALFVLQRPTRLSDT